VSCISDNELAALLEGTLAETRRAELEREVERCASCRTLVREWLVTDALPGEVASYALGDVLGAGAGGVVVRARDRVLERDVALKLFRAHGDALHEARTLATVRHPAVVAVHGAGASDGTAYIAMELVDGESLAARLARGPIPWRTAVAWFADVAAGLAAIHAAGLVHRDLKPANLLVDGERLRIADFGLAVRPGDAALAGTLPYVAPEVLDGAPADARSDSYSLFASLFETVTGHRPFRESDRRALRAAIGHGALDWPPGIPARVRRVVARGLAADPAQRWPDALAARTALAALVARRRSWIVAGAAAALALAGVAVVLLARPGEPAACDVGVPDWQQRLARPALTRVRARLASYADQLVTARGTACAGGARAAAQRACLERVRQRVDALVAGDDARDVEGAVFALPPPAYCATWTTAPVVDAPTAAALAGARAQLDLGHPRQALARADALVTAPGIALDIALVRGEAALALDNAKVAGAALRSALDGAVAAGRDDVAVAAGIALATLVAVRDRQAEAAGAYAAAARALAIRTGDVRSAAVARRVLGWSAFVGGDSPRAERETAGAIAELERLDAPLELARAELQYVALLRKRGDFAGARAQVERAAALRRDALGPDHPDTLAIDEDRAKIDAADGSGARARETMQRLIARMEQVLGRDHRALADPLTSLGAAQVAAGDYAGAEASLTRALALLRRERGELDASVARAYDNVAGLRVVQGRFGEAAELYRAGIAGARSVLGDDHPDVAPMYYGLGVALASAGRMADAADADGHAIAIYRAHPGRDGPLATALAARALIELGLGKLDEGRRDGEEALAILTRLHGPDHVTLAPALHALAQIELASGNLDRARELIERVLAIHAGLHASPRQTVEERLVLAQVLWRQHHHDEATALARRARADLGTDDPALASRLAAWLRAPS